jgi:hypothetical protein
MGPPVARVNIPIHEPEAALDRPRAAPLAAIGFACLIAGIGIARCSLDRDRAEEALGSRGTPSGDIREPRSATGENTTSASEPPTDPADRGARPSGAEVEDPQADGAQPAEGRPDDAEDMGADPVQANPEDREAEPSTPPPAPAAPPSQHPESGPATASADPRGATQPVRRGRIVPGRVAYLQCTGAEVRRGPIPCPRDLDLERGAWEVIRGLPSCQAPVGLPGTADVRVHFQPGAPVEVSHLQRGGGRWLDGDAVVGCLSSGLRQLRTSIRAEELIVSFRFELER